MTNPTIDLLGSSSDEDDHRPVAKKQKVKTKDNETNRLQGFHLSDSDSDIPAAAVFKNPARRPFASLMNNDSDDCSSSDEEIFDLIERKKLEKERQKTEKERQRQIVAQDLVSQADRKKLDKQRQKAKKERQKQIAAENRQRKKDEQACEKRERAVQKERERQEREMVKQALTQDKRDRKVAAQQTTGKFAKDEIGLVIDPCLLEGNTKETMGVFRETYDVIRESRGVDKGAVQFFRREYLMGGAQAVAEAFDKNGTLGDELVDRLVIVFGNPDDFLQLMDRDDNEDDYPKLEEWLDKVQSNWKRKWNRTENPKTVILLPGVMDEVHRQWNVASRNQRNSLMTDADINDAVVWLHITFRTECQPMSSFEQVLEFLLKMTRAISEEPYVQQVTELECVRKIKSSLEGETTPSERASDTWIRMLQQVPMLSASRAEQLAQYYPTARSLRDAYQQADDKELLVAHLFGERSQLRKLSEQLCRVMTGNDPREMLG